MAVGNVDDGERQQKKISRHCNEKKSIDEGEKLQNFLIISVPMPFNFEQKAVKAFQNEKNIKTIIKITLKTINNDDDAIQKTLKKFFYLLC